ncbi:MAG: sulfur carrier protein ThiS, partial [Polymorphobacter sp.]
MIEVSINGEPSKLAPGTTVAALLAELALVADKVAVERNLEIVPRSTFAEVVLANGDRL